MKKHLSKFLFMFAVFLCLSVAASAQKTNDDDKKGERKPPVIVVNKDRKPKETKPKDDDKDVKPQSFVAFILEKVGANS